MPLPKTLIIGDLHLHTYYNFGLSSDGKISKRLAEQMDVLDQILKIVLFEKITLVILVGDIIHKAEGLSVEAINVANEFINKLRSLGVNVQIVEGNHDIINRTKNRTEYQSAITLFKNLDICPPEIKLINYIDEVDYSNTKDFELVVLHKTPMGARQGNYTFDGKDCVNWKELANNNKLTVYGHIHEKQILSDKCIVIGPPMALDFSNTQQCGVYILENQKLSFHPLKYPKFITVENQSEALNDGNYYRVLNAETKSDNPNIVSVVKPRYFEEKLKGNTFDELLNEWLLLNNKDTSYLEVIKDILATQQKVRKIFKGKLLRLRIRNFFSIEDLTVEIENGFTQIKGLNGEGKSSIFEALYWCLFGKTTKKLTGDDVIRNRPVQQKEAIVEAFISNSNGAEGIIKRSSKDGLSVFKNIADQKSVLDGFSQTKRQEILENSLLGIDETLFLAASYYSQENLKMITTIGDTDKTNLITGLLGFEEYDLLYKECHNKQIKLQVEKREFEEKAKLINNEISFCLKEMTRIALAISGYNNKIPELKEQKIVYQEKIKELEQKLISKEEIVLVDYDIQIAELTIEKEVLNEDIQIITNLRQQKNTESIKLQTERSSLIRELESIRKSANELELAILKITRLETGTSCTTCGSPILKENKEIHIKEIELKRKPLLEKITAFEADIARLTLDIDRLFQEIAKIPNNLPSISSLEDQISKLNNKKFEQSERFRIQGNREKDVQRDISDYNIRLTSLDEKIIDCEKEIAKLCEENTLVSVQKNEKEVSLKHNACSIDVRELEINQLDFWKNAFSPRGIKSLLLSKFCNEFNTLVNKYIALISNGDISVILNPTKQLKSGEDRNELSLDITIEDSICKYQALSGGQKRRVDIGVCLALNAWVSQRYTLPNGLLGILIFDEVVTFIDAKGAESIASLFREEGINKALFTVAHNTGLEDYADRIWLVERKNKITQLSYIN